MDPVSRAQNSTESPRKKTVGRPFKKGQSGNPGGRPKKLHITKLMEDFLKRKGNREEITLMLHSIIKSGRMSAVLLLREMAERTEGRVAQEIEISGDDELLAKLLAGRKRLQP